MPSVTATDRIEDAGLLQRPHVAAGFAIARLDDTAAILAAAQRLGAAAAPTGFQAVPWLGEVYGGLAPDLNARPLALDVRDQSSGATLLLLPLVLRREGRLTAATFCDLGVSDYNMPLLSREAAFDAAAITKLWRGIRDALPEADVIRFERMLSAADGVRNPLAGVAGAVASRMSRNVMTIEGSVEDMLRARGKKFRKEAERCTRLLDKEGQRVFRRAETPEEIARAYAVLSAQQQARHEGADHAYILSEPAYAAFYERLLAGHSQSGFANLFTLEVSGEIVAALLGIRHGDTFTLLRISNGGERWRHASPGRLVVLDAMRHFLARGVNRFDMGMGDYSFKRGFGIEPEPLVDLVAAGSWRGFGPVAAARAKAYVRAHPRLRATAARLTGRGGA